MGKRKWRPPDIHLVHKSFFTYINLLKNLKGISNYFFYLIVYSFSLTLQPNIKDDQDTWISFCLGSKEKIQPTLNTLFCFNQPTVEQVLEYLVQFVETERKIEYKIGQWIYSLLAILEQPLQPDTCSCLRSLARACSIIRADSVKLIKFNY